MHHLCNGLDDGGAQIPPGGEIRDAIITDDLHILRDADFPAFQKFTDLNGKHIRIAENAVKFQFPLLDMLIQIAENVFS